MTLAQLKKPLEAAAIEIFGGARATSILYISNEHIRQSLCQKAQHIAKWPSLASASGQITQTIRLQSQERIIPLCCATHALV